MLRSLRIIYTYLAIAPCIVVGSFAIMAIALFRLPRSFADFVLIRFSRIALGIARMRISHVRWHIDPASLPTDASVVLIGDARAFLYGVPMSRLHYKTVFDVDPNYQLLAIGADAALTYFRWVLARRIEAERNAAKAA